MTDPIFSDIDRNERMTVVDGKSVSDEIREDGGTARPGLDDIYLAGFILLLNLLEELRIAIRSFL